MKKILIENGETRIGYSFDDLEPKVQEKVIDKFAQSELQYEWWENVYEDAKNVGIKINEFDYNRGMIHGEFYNGMVGTIALIKENHGENFDTYKIAVAYEQELTKIIDNSNLSYKNQFPNGPEADEPDIEQWFEDNNSDMVEELEKEFLDDILEDYLVMLRKEAEYISSEEYAKETIESHGYLFDEEGKILPITYQVKDGQVIDHRWKKYKCTITDYDAHDKTD